MVVLAMGLAGATVLLMLVQIIVVVVLVAL